MKLDKPLFPFISSISITFSASGNSRLTTYMYAQRNNERHCRFFYNIRPAMTG